MSNEKDTNLLIKPLAPTQEAPELEQAPELYPIIYDSKVTRDLLTVNKKKIEKVAYTDKLIFKSNNYNFELQARDPYGNKSVQQLSKEDVQRIAEYLSPATGKFLTFLELIATQQNNRKGVERGSLNPKIIVNTDEYARVRGFKIDPLDDSQEEKKKAQNQRKIANKEIREAVEVLKTVRVKAVSRTSEDYIDLQIIGSEGKIGRNRLIYMDPAYLSVLVRSPLLPYPVRLLALGNRPDDNNANRIGLAMASHYNKYNTIEQGNNNRLRVGTILDHTDLPDIEEIKKKRYGWTNRIKDPFELCLNRLLEIGFLKKWSYGKANGVMLTSKEKKELETKIDYKTFIDLRIYFELEEAETLAELRARRREKAMKNKRRKN